MATSLKLIYYVWTSPINFIYTVNSLIKSQGYSEKLS